VKNEKKHKKYNKNPLAAKTNGFLLNKPTKFILEKSLEFGTYGKYHSKLYLFIRWASLKKVASVFYFF